MGSSIDEFYASDVAAVHQKILQHPVALSHLSAEGIKFDGKVLGQDIEAIDFPFGEVSGADLAYLFCVFNGSRVHGQLERSIGPDNAPPGYYMTVVNGRVIAGGHKNKFGIVQREGGDADLFISDMHIDHLYLSKHGAPPLLGTLAFALCAITAMRAGLSRITLIAADGRYGGGYVGVKVWPKFGFDAPLFEDETLGHPQLNGCKTVQDVIRVDPTWWDTHGTQRLMEFDLTPGSTSWQKMLLYLSLKI